MAEISYVFFFVVAINANAEFALPTMNRICSALDSAYLDARDGYRSPS